jgi:hypothetical protein
MAPMHQLGDHLGEIGLNYGFSGPMGGVGDLNFHIGSSLGGGIGNGGVSGGGGSASILPVSGFEQWRTPQQTQQFPFLTSLEPSSSHGLLYPFEGGGGGNNQAHIYGGVPKVLSTNSSVKMEENQSRQFLGMINNNNNNNNPNNEQYWSTSGGNGGATSTWTDLAAFNSSSTTTNSNYRT